MKNERNKKIRVLHVLRSMKMGGAQALIMNLYKNINRNKIQFDFLLSDKGDYEPEILEMGGRVFYIPYLTEKGQISYAKELKNFFKQHPEYKIVHSHIDQVTGIIMESAKKSGVPIRIAHSHNTKNSNSIFGKIYKSYLQSKINKNSTHYFACSLEAAKWLFKTKAKEALVINNGVDIDKFKFSKEKRNQIRTELDIPEDYQVIGHIGAFRKQKNHSFLIDIYEQYYKVNPKSCLILVGDGELKLEIEEKVRNLPIKNNVKFVGLRKDVDKLYCGFDIFLFPSLYEGLSVALIEAQASGVTIVASDSIDKKTDITKNIKFVSLDSTKEQWLKSMNVKSNREINEEQFKNFNIKEVAKTIEKFYLTMK